MSVGLPQSWSEASAPTCSITSFEDKWCPRSWDELADWPAACTFSEFCQMPEGYWGPTERKGAARAWAPAHKSPGHRGEVTGTAAGGPQTQLPLDGSTCTFETPGFLQHPHSRRHSCLLLLTLASRFTPNLVLTCLVDSEKLGFCQERQRDRAQRVSKRTLKSDTSFRHPGHWNLSIQRGAQDLLRLYLYGVKSLWFILGS